MNNEKTYKILRIVLFALLTISIFLGAYKTLKDNKKEENEFSKEYPNVKEDNMYSYTDIKDALYKIENGSGVFFFCSKDIDNCKEVAQYLYEEAKDLIYSPVYYTDVKDLSDEYSKKLRNITKLDKDYYPLIVAVNKKEIVGFTTINADSKTYWTKENIESFKIEIMNYMNKIKANICDDTCE